MLTPSPPEPRPVYAAGTRPLRQIFAFSLLIAGIMFVGAAILYGITMGLLYLRDHYGPLVIHWLL